jgi:hypothetical protein
MQARPTWDGDLDAFRHDLVVKSKENEKMERIKTARSGKRG